MTWTVFEVGGACRASLPSGTVFNGLQMTLTIKSWLWEDVDLVEIFRSLFPCGSITGSSENCDYGNHQGLGATNCAESTVGTIGLRFQMDDEFSMLLFGPFNCIKGKPSMELAEALHGIALGVWIPWGSSKGRQFFIVNKLVSNWLLQGKSARRTCCLKNKYRKAEKS